MPISGPPSSTCEQILTLSCGDSPGIVHGIATVLLEHSGNIDDSAQFRDPTSAHFFMRVAFSVDPRNVPAIETGLARVADRFGMEWALRAAGLKSRLLLMVSRQGHCLNDLLFRHSTGSLPVDIRAVVSNHGDFRHLAESYGIAFHHLPVTAATKSQQEAQLMAIMHRERVDLVVLARYMQVLSSELCRSLAGRAINIHHSFLPSFKGSRPYHQAYERGVKLVGATAHYITPELDEGPIIEQDALPVSHAMSADDLVAAGRDVEATVLARAVKLHTESRVLLNGNKTVVLR